MDVFALLLDETVDRLLELHRLILRRRKCKLRLTLSLQLARAQGNDAALSRYGGESVVELIERVRGWMDSLTTRRTRLVAVTHPSVIRAAILVALNAPPKSFWRIDIAPVSRTVMHFRGHAWTLRTSL